jgi:hypothetical protein
MAQPLYAIEYLGAVRVTKNTPVTSASLLTLYPTATVLKIKANGVSVTVDNSVMFPVSFDDETYVTTGHTYSFSEDCVLAVGVYRTVT